jgi:signal transduction histidine kinase
LHDDVQQRFVHTILTLELARRAPAGVPCEGPELVAEALQNAERTNEELRELAHGMHPGTIRSGGLGPPLVEVAQRLLIPVTLDVRTHAPLPEHIEVTAYFVVSEAPTDAAKHAHASHVHVTVGTAAAAPCRRRGSCPASAVTAAWPGCRRPIDWLADVPCRVWSRLTVGPGASTT